MTGAWQELKRRKIVQWSLAYAAAAWVAVEVMDVLGDIFGLPVALQRAAVIALAFGLIVTIVLAWYHGEKGRQRVSGPELLIVAGVLMTAGATLTLVSAREDGGLGPPLPGDTAVGEETNDAPGDPDPRSIAVLPFADLSPAGDQEYLGDGIAEELLSQLSRIPGLRVASRTSSFSLEGEGLAVPQIGRRLGVGHVIEGSVRKSGARLRVEARLVSVDDGFRIWSERFETDASDIFGVQDSIAVSVARALRVQLAGDTPVPALRG